MIKIDRGLDLPISGKPIQNFDETKIPLKVAILGTDYEGLKPSMAVKIGDVVKKGELLFTNKKNPGVKFTSPVAGQIVEINRGERRAFQSIVIERTGDEEITFPSYDENSIHNVQEEDIRATLIDSGLWTGFRTRPYDKTPSIDSKPVSIFVTAIDTNPLSPHPDVVIRDIKNLFRIGLIVLSKLTSGKIFLCKGPNTDIPVENLDFVKTEVFAGPHPAGCVGTHVHHLNPVTQEKQIWHINYQDVINIAKLFSSGKISFEKIISIAGPQVKNPRLVKTIIGASLVDLLDGELKPGENRVISGSPIYGRIASGNCSYLGRFSNQVTVLEEDRNREFFGWISPGIKKFSIKNVVLSSLLPKKLFNFTTTTHGSLRSMVPIGMYEKIMPLDIEPTFLLRSILSGDTEMSQKLGCLDLAEEDMALCSFVCPSKIDFCMKLRENLNQIEKEG